MPKRKAAEKPTSRKSSRTRQPPFRMREESTPPTTDPQQPDARTTPQQPANDTSPALLDMIQGLITQALEARASTSGEQASSSTPAVQPPLQTPQAMPLLHHTDLPIEDSSLRSNAISMETMGRLMAEGESQVAPHKQPPPILNLSNAKTFDHIFSSLTTDMTSKILKRDLFDLSQLVPKDRKARGGSKIFDVTCDANTNSMSFSTKQMSNDITSFEKWIMAYSKYAAVRSHVFNDEGEGLLRHQYQVTHLYQSYPGSDCWADYDITYRQHLATHPTFQWGDPLHDLVLFSQNRGMMDRQNNFRAFQPINQFQRRNKQASSTNSVPSGFCFQFHKNGSCQNQGCQYSHKCPICFNKRGVSHVHSAAKCNARRSSTQTRPVQSNPPPNPAPAPTQQATPKRTSATNASQQR